MVQCGRECEVFSRVVGYYRPINNWNAGKAEEFKERKVFDADIALSGDNKFLYKEKKEKECPCDDPSDCPC